MKEYKVESNNISKVENLSTEYNNLNEIYKQEKERQNDLYKEEIELSKSIFNKFINMLDINSETIVKNKTLNELAKEAYIKLKKINTRIN